MNVFVLNAGRCGSTTFAHACGHVANFSSAHESRTGMIGEARLGYPPNHIEVDNRLSWFLGRLDKTYGNDAFYVHLRRADTRKTAISNSRRVHPGTIFGAYKMGILLHCPEEVDLVELGLDYCDTVASNIELFLKDKTNWMNFTLENARADFPEFWNRIGAEGNLDAALAEFDRNHNPTFVPKPLGERVAAKLASIFRARKKEKP
jgi:hypothetical protein